MNVLPFIKCPLLWLALSIITSGYAPVAPIAIAAYLKATGTVTAGLAALFLHQPGSPPVA
jgi:hypothetical protein